MTPQDKARLEELRAQVLTWEEEGDPMVPSVEVWWLFDLIDRLEKENETWQSKFDELQSHLAEKIAQEIKARDTILDLKNILTIVNSRGKELEARIKGLVEALQPLLNCGFTWHPRSAAEQISFDGVMLTIKKAKKVLQKMREE